MISGRIKIFKLSPLSLTEGAEVTTSDGSNGDFLLSKNNETQYNSINQDDSDVTINITFPPSVINRILLLDHNLKSFSFAQSFTNITDIKNKPLATIVETNNQSRVSYFAFDKKEISSLTLTIGKTNPAMEVKKIGRLIICEEIGTFTGYPEIKGISFSNNARNVKSKGGGTFVTKQKRTMSNLPLAFKNYFQIEDIALIQDLHQRQQSFLIWPCGGVEDNFRFLVEGYRLQDIYKVQTKGDIRIMYKDGSYAGLISASLKLIESI